MNRLLVTALLPICIGFALAFSGNVGSAIAEDAGLLADIPAPPSSKSLGTEAVSSGGQQASYSTSANPGAVIDSYKQALPAAGWTVTSSGGSVGSSGGGAGLQATNGPKYLSINAGGPAGMTFVHVCVWPVHPKDDHCGD
jgi:hypothetical protein